MKPDFSQLRVGDRVAYLLGPPTEKGGTNCVVAGIFPDDNYPILIHCGELGPYAFTVDGFRDCDDAVPTLYHTMPGIIGGLHPPKRKKKIRIHGFLNVHETRRGYHVTGDLNDLPFIEKTAAQAHAPKGCLGQIEINQELEVDE